MMKIAGPKVCTQRLESGGLEWGPGIHGFNISQVILMPSAHPMASEKHSPKPPSIFFVSSPQQSSF